MKGTIYCSPTSGVLLFIIITYSIKTGIIGRKDTHYLYSQKNKHLQSER